MNDELLDALRSHPQVVPHFHLPLQSGSDAILRRINRQYTRDDFLRMIERVKVAFDRPALTSDIIVAFPGETDAEFERTMEVVRLAGFIHIHAFPFSPRPGTAAARWTRDFVRGPVVNDRMERLRRSAHEHDLAYRQCFLGHEVTVIVERDAAPATLRHGRSERYFPVFFDAPDAAPGDLLRVRIDRVAPDRTFGTVVRQPEVPA